MCSRLTWRSRLLAVTGTVLMILSHCITGADPLSFREEIEENAAQRLPPTTIKNLYPVGGIQVRREDEQAAPTGLRTPVWSTRHIIPVGLTVVLDVALVQDQTAPLGATK